MLTESFLNDGWEFIQTKLDVPRANLGYSDPEWMSATVPGSIHLDLMEHGVIPNPFERMHEMGVQWIDETDWSYRCTFAWTPDKDLPKQVLVFEGLDTVCTVLLNGEKIAESDNMFLPVEVDVTGKLIEGDNQIRIDFVSAVNTGEKRMAEFFAAEGLLERVERFEDRSFVRKIQCMFGWDWGPRLVSCGIWKPVKLVEFKSRITHVSSTQTWNNDGSVTLTVHAEKEGEGELEYNLILENGDVLSSSDGVFTIQEPKLWWPAGEGDQVLHDLFVSLYDGDTVMDAETQKIGFRQIRLLREKDAVGESFEFEVNGRKVYAKGFNWIPDYSFPGALTRGRYEERLLQALDLNSNMIRIWGGGMYESEDFYDVCDELGIMVWQDFLHACAYYPDNAHWQEVIREEATYQVRRLRGRASLALWCGNNENLQMWQQKWQWKGYQHPPRFYGEHLYNEVFPSVLAQHHPQVSYIPTSPCGESEPDANGGKIGDSHYWDAWHGRGDWKYYLDSEARFSSEYGFASACTIALWKETLAEEDWDYIGNAVRWHDKTRKGYGTFVGYVELHYPSSETLEDWTYYSQLNQRDALRCGVEHFRRNSFCRGSLIWQLNDIWPTQSWAVIDSSGRYKAAAYELRRLYGKSLVSFERVKDKVRVHIVDDRAEGEILNAAFDFYATNLLTGEEVRDWSLEATIAPGDRKVIGELDLNGLPSPETLIWSGSSDNWHLLSEPKETRFAAPTSILGSNNVRGNSGIEGYLFEIQISQPVVDLMLSVDGDTSIFDENFLTLPVPGVYTIEVSQPITHFEARSLAGSHVTRMTRSPLE